jgi:hypothetical protein
VQHKKTLAMANEREYNQPQEGTGSAENTGRDRKEQFNELSELSLEERMNVADQIGVPVEQVSDAAATGAMSGRDDAAGGSGDDMENESTGEETDR